jgi:hypothetical protein
MASDWLAPKPHYFRSYNPAGAFVGLFNLTALIELATKDSCPKEPGLLT